MKLLHGVRSKVNQTEIKMANQNFIQGPKMDWTEDPDLHRHFREWREETELLSRYSTGAYQGQDYKVEICDSMGRKGSKNVSKHTLRGEKGQSTHFAKYIRRVDKTKSR